MRSLSDAIKKQALDLLKEGKSTRLIAKTLKISPMSVSRIKKCSNLERGNINKGGRPKKIEDREARHIGRLLMAGKMSVPRDGLPLLAQKASIWTLRRALNGIVYKAKKKKKKPALSAKNVSSRKAFLKRHENWTFEDWRRVILTL